ncbi:unnamed protein product [Gordionus sp. m RMFG-2023]
MARKLPIIEKLNEEIGRRQKEIIADELTAERLNASFNFTPSKDEESCNHNFLLQHKNQQRNIDYDKNCTHNNYLTSFNNNKDKSNGKKWPRDMNMAREQNEHDIFGERTKNDLQNKASFQNSYKTGELKCGYYPNYSNHFNKGTSQKGESKERHINRPVVNGTSVEKRNRSIPLTPPPSPPRFNFLYDSYRYKVRGESKPGKEKHTSVNNNFGYPSNGRNKIDSADMVENNNFQRNDLNFRNNTNNETKSNQIHFNSIERSKVKRQMGTGGRMGDFKDNYCNIRNMEYGRSDSGKSNRGTQQFSNNISNSNTKSGSAKSNNQQIKSIFLERRSKTSHFIPVHLRNGKNYHLDNNFDNINRPDSSQFNIANNVNPIDDAKIHSIINHNSSKNGKNIGKNHHKKHRQRNSKLIGTACLSIEDISNLSLSPSLLSPNRDNPIIAKLFPSPSDTDSLMSSTNTFSNHSYPTSPEKSYHKKDEHRSDHQANTLQPIHSNDLHRATQTKLCLTPAYAILDSLTYESGDIERLESLILKEILAEDPFANEGNFPVFKSFEDSTNSNYVRISKGPKDDSYLSYLDNYLNSSDASSIDENYNYDELSPYRLNGTGDGKLSPSSPLVWDTSADIDSCLT